ncbi:hypothetical protein ABPG73_011082 [Tetrahymena malaccensis]
MEFYERVCGARMHAAFYRPNEVNLNAVSSFLMEDILEFRTYSFQTCLDYGLTGVMARSCGLKRDLRLSKTETYANYYYLNFRSYTGQHGDCYDRFLIRMNEIKGLKVESGYTYQSVESPKGEFGVSMLSDGSNKPYKCKVRSPALHHLQVLPKIGKGHFLADLVALVGTVDIVFGEIDRQYRCYLKEEKIFQNELVVMNQIERLLQVNYKILV